MVKKIAVSYRYLSKMTVGCVMFAMSIVPLAYAENSPSKSAHSSHYKKGASCVQESSKAAMFTCWGMFENKLVDVEEIYRQGWRVVAFKPRTDNPDILDNGMLIIEEQ